MTRKTCDTCGEDKPLDNFAKAGRGRRATCEDCRTPAPTTELASPEADPDGPRLEMAPGFGFKAYVRADGTLVISQADSEGNLDTILLSRTEAKVLFAGFTEWAQ
jgi:hypothetical protein